MCEDLLVHVDKGGDLHVKFPLLVVAGHDGHDAQLCNLFYGNYGMSMAQIRYVNLCHKMLG